MSADAASEVKIMSRRTRNIIKCSLYGSAAAVLLLAAAQTASAQASGNRYIRKGNKLYEKQDFTDAEVEYQRALAKDSVSSAGLFNLGNSLYQQKRYSDAAKQYAASAKASSQPLDASAAHYNLGNTFMTAKQWQQAVDAYKQSLLKNPSDQNARYNLAYAQEMLKKQQNKGGGKNDKQNNKDQKNQNKQNQDKNQQNKNQQNKDQQNKDQQNQNKDQKDQDQQNQHPQPQPSKIDKQRADQLLNAAAQAEKKLQDDKDKKQKGIPVSGGKDW